MKICEILLGFSTIGIVRHFFSGCFPPLSRLSSLILRKLFPVSRGVNFKYKI